jgi:putative membrane protein
MTMKGKGLHLFFVVSLALVLIWSMIRPNSWLTWFLEVSPILVLWAILIWLYPRFKLTDLSYTWIWISSIIVIVGGHYTYEEMPLFDWVRDFFGWERNHYDRFGHFVKGVTTAIVAREVILRKTPVQKSRWIVLFVLSISLAFAALYEIVEFASVLFMEERSRDFLGMQGDRWDSQWDMVMTFAGALLALPLFRRYHDRQMGKLPFRH